VCETWFSPGMAGVDSAGLGEVLQNVITGFPDNEKGRFVQVRVILIYPSQGIHRLFRTCLSPVHRAIYQDLFPVCKTHFGQSYLRKCHLRLCVPQIHHWMHGKAWRISQRQKNSSMSALPKQNMKTGAGRGSKDGGAATGIQAL
jgi:hypothetical protein